MWVVKYFIFADLNSYAEILVLSVGYTYIYFKDFSQNLKDIMGVL